MTDGNQPRAFRLRRVDAFVFRVPLQSPVRTSFGTMRDRPAVLVRVTDPDGAEGWGEVWCNFPSVGAEHRARLVRSVLAPAAVDRDWDTPEDCFDALSQQTAVLAIQSGEPGPLAQAIAGIDTAVWDLLSRKAGIPLWRYLGGRSDRIPVYASGLNPDAPERIAAACQAAGHRAFKLKVGFGPDRDLENLTALRRALGDEATLMVDANQAWTPPEAAAMLPALEPFRLGWLEEPLRADRPWSDWLALRDTGRTPLAAGENLAGHAAFDEAIAAGVLTVVQPDLAKWGGISAGLPVARRILAAGLRYCPHYLGAGIGVLASGHLLAAAGGDGWLEVDSNPNPLRTALWGPLGEVEAGFSVLGSAPGLGPAPTLDALARWAVTGG